MKRKGHGLLSLTLTLMLLIGCGNSSQTGISTETEEDNTMVVETETEPEPVVTTVTISATGDCALGKLESHSYGGSFAEYYDTYGEAYFFKNFKEVFEQDDLTLINLECVLSDSTSIVEKTFNIKGGLDYAGIMTSSSVEACSLGNNHTLDYGQEGLADTKEVLDAAGIAYAYNDIVSYYTTEEGIVVAIVSSVAFGSQVSEDYLINGIVAAREQGADIVVACAHWGIEYDHYPYDYQQTLGHKLVDAGADLVIGNHPHCLQGVEEYNGKLICYSLGNFSFGANKNPSKKDTVVFQQTFTFVDGVLQTDITANIIPARISGYSNYNNYQPIIVEGDAAKSIIEQMNQYSAPYGGVSFTEDGTLVVTEE